MSYNVGDVLTSEELSQIQSVDGYCYIDDQVSGLKRYSYPWGSTGYIKSYRIVDGVFNNDYSLQTPNADQNQLYEVIYSDADRLVVTYQRTNNTFAESSKTTFTIYLKQ